jgi:hypothetical protein
MDDTAADVSSDIAGGWRCCRYGKAQHTSNEIAVISVWFLSLFAYKLQRATEALASLTFDQWHKRFAH